jgi:hypothetical protein
MGNTNETTGAAKDDVGYDRNLYVKFVSFQKHRGYLSSYVVYKLNVSYRRFTWIIHKRHKEILELDSILIKKYSSQMSDIVVPRRRLRLIFTHDTKLLQQRGIDVALYLEKIGSHDVLFNSSIFKEFLEIGVV